MATGGQSSQVYNYFHAIYDYVIHVYIYVLFYNYVKIYCTKSKVCLSCALSITVAFPYTRM